METCHIFGNDDWRAGAGRNIRKLYGMWGIKNCRLNASPLQVYRNRVDRLRNAWPFSLCSLCKFFFQPDRPALI